MLSKPIVIVAALLFSVSVQANAFYAENKTDPQTQLTTTDATLKTEPKGEAEHESVVLLAQGMSGFLTF